MKRRLLSLAFFCAAVVCAFLFAGCAKYPAGGNVPLGRQLIVTLRVRGQIQPQDALVPYYYFVLLNPVDEISTPGPVPVVDRPWGNGFAAPAPGSAPTGEAAGFTAFVRYSRFESQGGYQLYRVEGNPVQGFFVPLGPPDQYTTPQPGETVLTFRLDLSRVPGYVRQNPDGTPRTARFLQINLLATNNIPQGADDAPKFWDALGNGANTGSLNAYQIVDTTQDRILRNTDLSTPEPANDVRDHLGSLVPDPNLDIVDWTIEVRS